ncbi:hypothetical protein R1sor_022478 [Riccia sorocarpa]|uniref:Uncharacterized protein n=1 Tax=Riccia sorocarpa TaxID=122646 RepID=A0ABD3GMZ4_9MARC
MPLSLKSLNRLEQVCRKFVWGQNTEGRQKLSLIAWEVLQRTKKEGGLGIPSFTQQSAAMRLKQLVQCFEKLEKDWVYATEALVQIASKTGKWSRARRHWNLRESLLVMSPTRIADIKLVRQQLKTAKVKSIGNWSDWAEVKNTQRPLSRAEDLTVDIGLKILVSSQQMHEQDWNWDVGMHTIRLPKLTTQTWRSILGKPEVGTPRLNKILGWR